MVGANANGSYQGQLSTITKHTFLRAPQDNNAHDDNMKCETNPVLNVTFVLRTKGIGELICGHFVLFYRFLKPII